MEGKIGWSLGRVIVTKRQKQKKMWGARLKTPWEATEGLGGFENSPEFMTLALSAPVSAKRT